ncbi:germin-like protein subfamily 1 member 20 isoform X1 [Tripterygium wilfordii]|uniref:germin-like protein subfamily 1 member 20 isoform X1 n=1 Tax=Tripterygium wilfordii TaxID=458696 RepID=UPI0018F7F8A1|nr:germin-like protein subfamily 1 member 20 isoform X1 [Tripterygium wilfordii]
MRVATHHFLIIAFVLLALASSLASAYDPSPLHDFCVGVNQTKYGVFINGKFCKDPKLVTTNDFVFSDLNIPANTSNRLGSNVTFAFVDQFLGLNTLGVTISHVDYAPNGGLNPPHYHPRGSEILLVLKGILYAGFVTSNQDNNRLFTKALNLGDLMVFPIGLPHFQLNVGNTSAVAIVAFGTQNPGVITIANAVFGSNPPINPDVLSKAFLLEKSIVQYLQQQF